MVLVDAVWTEHFIISSIWLEVTNHPCWIAILPVGLLNSSVGPNKDPTSFFYLGALSAFTIVYTVTLAHSARIQREQVGVGRVGEGMRAYLVTG